LSYGEELDWHLLSGTRPRGSSEQGRAWGKEVFAGKIGISARQLRNWLQNKNLPAEIETIEQVLFGNDQEHAREWRLDLREATANQVRCGAGRWGAFARAGTAAAGFQYPNSRADTFHGARRRARGD
jgi:hypothetical protein